MKYRSYITGKVYNGLFEAMDERCRAVSAGVNDLSRCPICPIKTKMKELGATLPCLLFAIDNNDVIIKALDLEEVDGANE